MARRLLILVPLSLGLCAVGGMPHPKAADCYAIESGLDAAADLSWMKDTAKASQLRESFESVRLYSKLLALGLRNDSSVENTRQLQMQLLQAGKAFRERAAALGVRIPAEALNEYLDHAELCSRPY